MQVLVVEITRDRKTGRAWTVGGYASRFSESGWIATFNDGCGWVLEHPLDEAPSAEIAERVCDRICQELNLKRMAGMAMERTPEETGLRTETCFFFLA